MKVQVKEGEKSEGFFVMKKIDVETLRHAKAGRLSPGLLLRENLKNLLKEKGK
jgi:hypothetical protein